MKAILYINQFFGQIAEKNSLVMNRKSEKELLARAWPMPKP